MKSWLCRVAVLAVLIPVAGCLITFGDDDGDDVICTPTPQPAPIELRDPFSGTCQPFGGGGGGCGYDQPVPTTEPWPDWAYCYRGCEGLDENTCQATPGCRAAYVLPEESPPPPCVPGADCPPPGLAFLECWGVAQSGPIHGTCDGLDAYACSQHDDCTAIYRKNDPRDPSTQPISFGWCAPEAGPTVCYQDSDCGDGYECYRAPDECWPPPGCGDPNGPACPPVCYGRCVPKQSTCDTVRCMAGTHCEEQC